MASSLPAVLADPGDTELRRRAQIAACAAGIGIDRCGTGIGHAIGHAIASLLSAPHGLLVMLGTLVTINWSVEQAADRYSEVTRSIEPSAQPGDLPQLVSMFAARVDYERHLAGYAARQELDGAALADELPRDVHKPMWSNNAAVPGTDDLAWVANSTAREWARIGGLAQAE